MPDIDHSSLFDDVLFRLVRMDQLCLVRLGWAVLLVTFGQRAEGEWNNTKSSGGRTRRIGELRQPVRRLQCHSRRTPRTVYMQFISCSYIAVYRMSQGKYCYSLKCLRYQQYAGSRLSPYNSSRPPIGSAKSVY